MRDRFFIRTGASPLGAWVQGEGEILRTTRNMLFAQGLVLRLHA